MTHSDLPASTLDPGAITGLLKQLAMPEPAAAPDDAPIPAGSTMGRFEILRPLGEGTFGRVYEARDRTLGRLVAVKVLRRRPAAAGDAVEREAEAVAQLSHPNIVTLHDIGVYDGWPYLVLELLHGETLRARLRRGPLRAGDALAVAIEVARGAASAPPAAHAISPPIAELLSRALDEDPAARPPSGGAWLDELRAVDAALRSTRHARPRARPGGGAPRSVVVLPFHDLSDAGDQQHVCEGIADEISSQLARVPHLSVIARPSGATRDADVARRLRAETVVEGSLQKRAGRFRFAVRWLDTATRHQRWAETFEGEERELFSLQRRIAAAVSDRVAPSGRPARAAPAAVDFETYELYLRGRLLWGLRPGPVVWEALECFEKAVQRAPGFAAAWTGIADVYNTLGSWEAGVLPHEQALSKAMACALRALELDPELAEAHTALAYAALHYQWDSAASEAAFRRAIALKPSYGNALHWYSHDLVAAGRFEESLMSSRAAVAVEPMSLLFNVHLAWHHHMARQPWRVLEEAEHVVRMDPGFHWGHYFASWGAEALGDHGRALTAMEEAVRRSGGNAVMLGGLARCRALAGDAPGALGLVRDLEQRGGAYPLFAYEIALVHLALGDHERALEGLERAHAARSGWMAYAHVEPRLDPLRGEPRFDSILPPGIRAT